MFKLRPADAGADSPERTLRGRLKRMPYFPALDGLRAVAVMAVLVYHSGIGWLPGGFLGVEVFFVISGYLITSMLLNERSGSGSVNLGAFWARRARRLLPAVFVLLIGVLAYCAIFLPGEVAELRWEALAAAGYVSNWYQIFHEQAYFESFGRPSLLRHLWSLAVEEQFYVIWPLVFAVVVARLPRRKAVAAVAVLAVASATLMAVLYEPHADPSRIYYGTDTRAAGLLVGAALALVWVPGRLSRDAVAATRSTAGMAGFLGVAGIIAFTVAISESDRFLFQGGFLVLALLTALAIGAAVHPDAHGLKRVLGWGPLVWIGLRSYSIYLWHWPVFMVTRPHADIALDGIPLLALRLGITLVLADLSYRLVETPFRSGALGREWGRLREAVGRPRWELSLRYGGLAAAAAVLAVAVAGAEEPAPPAHLAVEHVQTGAFVANRGAVPDDGSTASAASAAPTPTPPPASGVVEDAESAYVSIPAPDLSVGPEYIDAGRVTAIGDSVMLGAVDALTATIEGISIDAAASRQFYSGTSLLRSWRDAGLLGDAVIVHLGAGGYFSSGQFDEMMEVLADVRLVVFVNLKVPRDWEDANNGVLADGVSRYGNAVLVDWHSAATDRPDLFWDDGTHVRPAGAQMYAGLIAGVLAAHPAPTPEPTPEPTVEPAPEPMPEVTPELTPEPVPPEESPAPEATPEETQAATEPPPTP